MPGELGGVETDWSARDLLDSLAGTGEEALNGFEYSTGGVFALAGLEGSTDLLGALLLEVEENFELMVETHELFRVRAEGFSFLGTVVL